MYLLRAICCATLVCGILGRNNEVPANGSLGIVGGHSVEISSVPYMASLRLNGSIHWCGASIIHEQFVITAAHCIVPNREYKVLVGTDLVDGDGELYDVSRLIVHDKFSSSSPDYDVCLIKVAQPFKFDHKVSTIKLVDTSVKIKTGTIVDITGWGNTKDNGTISETLQQTSIPIVSHRSCKLTYFGFRQKITSRMICAGEAGRDACQGDSGGPLTYQDYLVGISSFGAGCGSQPGVYTKITAFLPWIRQKMQENL